MFEKETWYQVPSLSLPKVIFQLFQIIYKIFTAEPITCKSKLSPEAAMTSTLDPKRPRGRFPRRIQGQLILIILIMVIPTFLVQIYIYRERFEARRTEEFQANLEIARAFAKAFDAFVLDILHNEAAIGVALTTSNSLSVEENNRILARNILEDTAVTAFSLIDPKGVIIASSIPLAIGRDISDREHFKAIAAGRNWSISELTVSRTTGEPAFMISRALRDDDGGLLGIVSAIISPKMIERVLGIERSEGSSIVLVDHTGKLVYCCSYHDLTFEERNWLKQSPQFQKALSGEE